MLISKRLSLSFIKRYPVPYRIFSTEQNQFPESKTDKVTQRHEAEEKIELDLNEIKELNPKLYDYLIENPDHFAEFQSRILEQTPNATLTSPSVSDISPESIQYKPNKTYSLPLFWGWLAPVFKLTAAGLITIQGATHIPWLPFIVLCAAGVRISMAPFLVKQMILINKIGQASPNIRLASQVWRHSQLNFFKKTYLTARCMLNYSKQTNTSLLTFYFYNLIQIPVFIIMVMSIRKIAVENNDLAGQGILWFKDLNEADPTMILPIIATVLNYFMLGRGITKDNEHWFVNRFRSFFQVLQIFHLPFTHAWPAGSFVYWIFQSLFVLTQQQIMKTPWFLQKVNPNFFFDYAKLYGEKTSSDHQNYVERILNQEHPGLKPPTSEEQVMAQLDAELKQVSSFSTIRNIRGYKDDFFKSNDKL